MREAQGDAIPGALKYADAQREQAEATLKSAQADLAKLESSRALFKQINDQIGEHRSADILVDTRTGNKVSDEIAQRQAEIAKLRADIAAQQKAASLQSANSDPALFAGLPGNPFAPKGTKPSISLFNPSATTKAATDALAALKEFNSGLQGAESASLSGPLKDYLDTMTKLTSVYDEAVKKGGDLAQAQALFDEKAAEANKTLGLQQKLLEASAMADFLKQNRAAIDGVTDAEETFRDVSAMATKALDEHAVSWEQYVRIIERARDSLNGVQKPMDEMSEFAKQAARNMQDTFANFLFDPFKDGVKGMVGGFIDALRRMAAEALAAKVFDQIGAWGQSNKGGGGFMGLLADFASSFGGGKASGGPVLAGSMYRVNENGPEMLSIGRNDYLMMGSRGGYVTPASRSNGSGGNTFITYVQPTTTRRTADQTAQAIARTQRLAVSRG